MSDDDFTERLRAAIEALEKAKRLVEEAIDKFGEEGDGHA